MPTPSSSQVQAQVLDHVVGAGVADGGRAVGAGGGEQRVLGDGVAALGQHDGAAGPPVRRHRGVVLAGPRLDVQAERAQRDHVRLRRCGCRGRSRRRRAARKSSRPVQQRAEEHDDAAGAAGGVGVDRRPGPARRGRRSCRSWPLSSQVAATPIERSTSRMRSTSTMRATLRSVVRPRLSSAAHSSATRGVLGRLDVDAAAQRAAALDTQVRGPGRPDG